MRILVLGGTGFIGSSVVQRLKGHDVTVFCRGSGPFEIKDVKIIRGDCEHIHGYRDAFSQLDPDVTLDLVSRNGEDAKRVMQALSLTASRIVAISSISIYWIYGRFLGLESGEVVSSPVDESAPRRSKLYPYRGRLSRDVLRAKPWLESYDKIPMEDAYINQDEKVTTIIRLPLVYGPGDPDYRIFRYVKAMRQNQDRIVIPEAVGSWRNARCYVDNAAEAIATIVQTPALSRIYNLADPQHLTELQWILKVAECCLWKGEVELDSNKLMSSFKAVDEFSCEADYGQCLCLDTSLLQREFQSLPTVSVEESLQRTIEAYARGR